MTPNPRDFERARAEDGSRQGRVGASLRATCESNLRAFGEHSPT
jgi:hypothetical protein